MGQFPAEVQWIGGAEKSTEFTYDVGSENVSSRETDPTDQEVHETLQITRYSPRVPQRREVDLHGEYSFIVNSRGLQVVADTENATSVRPRQRQVRQQEPERADDSLSHEEQVRARLVQPRRPPNARRSMGKAKQGPFGGKLPRRKQPAKGGHWFLRGRER